MVRSVCITPYIPYRGIDHAGGDYVHRYLQHLTQVRGWDVTLVAPGTAANRSAQRLAPQHVVLHPANADASTGRRALRSVIRGADQVRARTWLEQLPSEVRLDEADIVDFQWSESIFLAPEIRSRRPEALLIGTAHDLLATSLQRGLRSPDALERARSVLSIGAARRRERSGMRSCDHLLVFNPEDVARIKAFGVTAPVDVAPPVVDLADVPAATPGSPRLLFTGALWRPENDEAALWFLDEVLPVVREHHPDVRVRLAGARPSAALRGRASETVEVTGYLNDLTAAYRDVGVVIAPLRRGAGLKFKVVQAMAAGFPVVSTSVGAEGVVEVAGIAPTVVADQPGAFAEGIVRVLRDHPGEVRRASEIARGVSARLNFARRVDLLVAHYLDLLVRAHG